MKAFINTVGTVLGVALTAWGALTIWRAFVGGYVPLTGIHLTGSALEGLAALFWVPAVAGFLLYAAMFLVAAPFALAERRPENY